MDRAFLRRFMYAIEFEPLGIKQRTRILARHVADDAAVSSADIAAIAARFACSPGLFANAVSAAKLNAPSGEPDRAQIERVLEPIAKLVDPEPPRKFQIDLSSYRLDAVHSSEDLVRIAERRERWQIKKDPGISLCLYGPPGTGKSAYVHYLARCMKRLVLHKRVSDLLGPYLGQTEKAIAQAFREAERDGAVLSGQYNPKDMWVPTLHFGQQHSQVHIGHADVRDDHIEIELRQEHECLLALSANTLSISLRDEPIKRANASSAGASSSTKSTRGFDEIVSGSNIGKRPFGAKSNRCNA